MLPDIEVDEHHVGVYASRSDGHMVNVAHPKSLLHGSPVSASVALRAKRN